jgi:hypothetical protein
LADQEDNFAYIEQQQAEAVRNLLADNRPWQGQRLQQVKPQLDAIQLSIAELLVSEKAAAVGRVAELEQRLKGADEYKKLSASSCESLALPFATVSHGIQAQKRVAMIRDQVRHFEDEGFPKLLVELEALARPAPAKPAVEEPTQPGRQPTAAVNTGDGSVTKPTTQVATAPAAKVVPSRNIKVSFTKPWLATEADLDDYLQKLREAWLSEIQAGNRVQI